MNALNKREMAESKKAAEIPCKSFVRRRVSRSAYIRALETEGAHIATPEGDPWWADQERKHPCILAAGHKPEGTDSINGHTNRYGKVGYRARFVDGKLIREVWREGGWKKAEESKVRRAR